MNAWLLTLAFTLTLGLGLGLAPAAHATYSAALTSDGLASRTLKPGDSFDLDVELASDSVDRHDSSVLHLVFSSSGLTLLGYSWATPYQTGGPDDASVPARSTLPATITPATAAGTALPTDTADLWFSNLTTSGFVYGVGRVLRLSLSIPTQYRGPDRLTIRLTEATFARGVRTLPATVAPFNLHIQPAAGLVVPALTFARGSNSLALSWDATIVGAFVETTDDSVAGTWTRVNANPIRDGDRNTLTPEPSLTGTQRFYRLRFP